MEVIRAETAGFCMGVDLALQKLDSRLVDENLKGTIYTLGPIIHNPQVLDEYKRLGVVVTDDVNDIPAGATAIIRAHGVPKETEAELIERKVRIVDATCPKVKRAQVLIRKHTADGRPLLLYGELDHPEVRGLLSYAGGETFVFETRQKLAGYHLEPGRPYCLAAQTTQDRETFEHIASDVRERAGEDVMVLSTICEATKSRQLEAIDVADGVEVMVVVGGYNSGNTRRLAQVVTARGIPCIHVETASELNSSDFVGRSRVGLTAGASTPKKIIDEVQAVLERF